jgi:hypothetical protein
LPVLSVERQYVDLGKPTPVVALDPPCLLCQVRCSFFLMTE